MNRFRLPLALSVLLFVVGCGGGDKSTKPVVPSDGLPSGTPAADSPTHLAQRLEATWESEVEAEYGRLLTSDFRYHFSASSDPDLVVRYPEGLSRSEEIGTLTNLFNGFTSSTNGSIPGTSHIVMQSAGATDQVDPDHPDSTAQYRVLHFDALAVSLTIGKSPDDYTYQVVAAHDLHLVRGDAAVLPSGAIADTTRWYVRRWDDLSLPFGGGLRSSSAVLSLGRIKSMYVPEPPAPPEDGLPDGTPQADSPTHVLTRMEATWESKVEAEYMKLLSGDFRFHFSAASDPQLVDQYPNWNRSDDEIAIVHMFHGFTNSNGLAIPGASGIDMTLAGLEYYDDPEHADSTAMYQKVVVPVIDLTIEVPFASDPAVYQVSGRQEFYVVRGDVAVLPSGAVPDIDRWYIRRWDDLAVPVFARKGPVINPARSSTIGSIRSLYRN